MTTWWLNGENVPEGEAPPAADGVAPTAAGPVIEEASAAAPPVPETATANPEAIPPAEPADLEPTA